MDTKPGLEVCNVEVLMDTKPELEVWNIKVLFP